MKVASDFSDVDASGRADALAGYLQKVSADETIAAAKRARDLLLRLAPGDRALEVGCGLGGDAARLAGLVGESGSVVGVDASEALLERAEAVHGSRIQWRRADAHSLPFEAGEFAAARVERTLQHVRDPAVVVSEMARVVRPGGVVVATEPDWGAMAMSSPDQALVDRMHGLVEEAIRNARVGRMLPGLLADAGVEEVEVTAEPLVLRTMEHVTALFDVAAVAGAAVEQGVLSSAATAAFVEQLQADAQSGRLLVCGVLITAWGRVAPGA